jgi:ribosomal protein S18
MSGKVEWWAEEVALEHVVLAAEERERLSRRRAARLAASEEQERWIRQVEIARAMDLVERMEEREIAKRMEEAERRRRMKEIQDAQEAALQEQYAQRSSALHSFLQERDRILHNKSTALGSFVRAEPLVSLAMERDMQRRTASEIVSGNKTISQPENDAMVSSAVLLQHILAKSSAHDKTAYSMGDVSGLDSRVSELFFASKGEVGRMAGPTPRTEFSRRVKPVGINNYSVDLSQDGTGTSTMNITEDSAINPLLSFGSPSRLSPFSSRTTPNTTTNKTRMDGLAEEDSLVDSPVDVLSPLDKTGGKHEQHANLLPAKARLDGQRLLDASDAVTRDLFLSAMQPAAPAASQARESPAASGATRPALAQPQQAQQQAQASAEAWTLRVSRMAAFHVPNMLVAGSSDPYLRVSVGEKELMTSKDSAASTGYKTEWMEVLEFVSVQPHVGEAVLTLMDGEREGRPTVLGSVSVALDVVTGGVHRQQHLELNVFKAPSTNAPKVQVMGPDNKPTVLRLHLSAIPVAKASTARSGEGGGGNVQAPPTPHNEQAAATRHLDEPHPTPPTDARSAFQNSAVRREFLASVPAPLMRTDVPLVSATTMLK